MAWWFCASIHIGLLDDALCPVARIAMTDALRILRVFRTSLSHGLRSRSLACSHRHDAVEFSRYSYFSSSLWFLREFSPTTYFAKVSQQH